MNKMKNKKYYTVGTVPNSDSKIVEEAKSMPLKHKYMTADSPVSTVYSKIHSAAANYVTGAINTYIFTKHGIEMRGTNK